VAVIEDDHSFRRALGRSLELQGFQTETFASAEQFLQRSASLPADCIVLDIHLGEMSGLELQAELAAASVRTPIIFITAFDDPIARQRALEGGAAGFLQKPFGDQALTSAITRAVAPR
jgi:FixJ family two-component response regulator